MTACRYSCLPAALLALMTAASALAQEGPSEPTLPVDGVEVFRYLLSNRQLAAVPDVAALADVEPDETLVVFFGSIRGVTDRLPQSRRLDEFLRQGGSALIASDMPDQARLATLGVRVSGFPMRQHEPRAGYRDNPECPLLTTFQTPAAPLVQGIRRLATNRPSYLHLARGSMLRAVATFPPGCSPNPFRDRDVAYEYIAATPALGRPAGRVVVLAGHGLFTNGMLLQTDNDNFDFAVNCLDWLREGPGGRPRSHALFVVDGEVIPSFAVPLRPPLPPLPVPTVQLVNQLLHGMEREGLLIELLRDSVDVRATAGYWLLGMTMLLLLYGAKRLAEQRYHPEKGSVLAVGPYATAAGEAPLSDRRRGGQIEHAAFGAEARALARQWFFEVCGIAPADWDRAPPPEDEPRTAGGWWAGFTLRRQYARVRRVAAGSAPAAFSWGELVRLTAVLQELHRAVREGRLRLPGCSPAENS